MGNDDIMAKVQHLAAEARFMAQFNELLGVTVSELLKDVEGKPSDRTKAAIHARLPAIYEAAMGLGAKSNALVGLDLFLAMFPPPARQRPD